MLPGETPWVAINLGDYGNKNQGLQFALQALVHIVCFQQPIDRISILVDADIFFERAFKFFTEIKDKIRYPAIARCLIMSLRRGINCGSIVLMPVRDKNIVFITGDNGWHNLPNIPS